MNNSKKKLAQKERITDTFSVVGNSWKEIKRTYVFQGVRGRTIEFGPNNKRTFKTEVDTNGKMVAFWVHAPEPGITFQFVGNGEIWLDDLKLVEVTK